MWTMQDTRSREKEERLRFLYTVLYFDEEQLRDYTLTRSDCVTRLRLRERLEMVRQRLPKLVCIGRAVKMSAHLFCSVTN